MLTKKQIDGIQARRDEARDTYNWSNRHRELGALYVPDVSVLLDALEEAKEESLDCFEKLGKIQRKNERLREAAEYGEHLAMIVHLDMEKSSDATAYTMCYRCKRPFVRHRDAQQEGQHADDCPFKILEE